jgi:hypothetical protein
LSSSAASSAVAEALGAPPLPPPPPPPCCWPAAAAAAGLVWRLPAAPAGDATTPVGVEQLVSCAEVSPEALMERPARLSERLLPLAAAPLSQNTCATAGSGR